MSILSGFKRFKDYLKTDSGYQLMSRWTKSDAVVMGDGTDDTNTLEKNLGAIKGITDSLTSTSSNIALSSKYGKSLQDKINGLQQGFGYNSLNKYRCVGIQDEPVRIFSNGSAGVYTFDHTVYINIGSKWNSNIWLVGKIPEANMHDVIKEFRLGYYQNSGTPGNGGMAIFSLDELGGVNLKTVTLNDKQTDTDGEYFVDYAEWYITYRYVNIV